MVPTFSGYFFDVLRPAGTLVTSMVVATTGVTVEVPMFTITYVISVWLYSIPFPDVIYTRPLKSAGGAVCRPIPPERGGVWSELLDFLLLCYPTPTAGSTAVTVVV